MNTLIVKNDAPAKIDGPNHNELERMEEITSRVKRAIDFSRRLKFNKAQLDFETAEELLQMLSDGLRTAKQLQGQKRDWRIDLSVQPRLRTHPLYRSRGIVEAVFPSGWGGIEDRHGVLQIQMTNGNTILQPAEDWVTA